MEERYCVCVCGGGGRGGEEGAGGRIKNAAVGSRPGIHSN